MGSAQGKDKGKGPEQSTDEVVLHGPSALARLLLDLDEQWPSLRFVGFGLYYAWIWLCYDSTTLLDASIRANADTTFAMYLASTTALGLTLVLAAAFPAVSARLTQNKPFLLAMGLLAGIATVFVKLMAPNGAFDSVFLLFCVLTGLGTAWVCLRMGMEYASVGSRRATMNAAAAFVAASLMYFLVRGLPEHLGLGVMALLPLGATLCTLTPAGDAPMEEPVEPHDHLLPRGFFLRLMFAIAVFSVVVGVTRGFSVLTQATNVLDDRGCMVVFGMALVAMLLYVLVGTLGNDFDVSRLYYPVIILASLGILVMPLVEGAGQAGGVFVGIAYACFIMIMWCLFAHVAYVTGAPAVRVFGLGRGTSALGTTAGWLLGSQLAGHEMLDATSMFVVSCVMVLALLVVSMLVFNDRAVGMVLRMVGKRAAQDAQNGKDLAGADHSMKGALREVGGNLRSASLSSEQDGDEAQAGESDRAGTWTRSCLDIAARFGLSQRETDVLFLLAKGRTIAFIADELGVSFNTAKSHIRHVYVKIGVHTKSELLDLVEQGRK